MDRRNFLSLTGVVAASAASSFPSRATPATLSAAQARATDCAKRGKVLFKLGCQSGPSDDERFAYFARFGVLNVCGNPQISDPDRSCPNVQELEQLMELGARHGISIDMVKPNILESSNIDKEQFPAIMLGQGAERDRDIEAFQNLIRDCATVGIPAIKYNMSLLGVLRNFYIQGRGDARYRGWRLADADPNLPLTRAGIIDSETFWERIHYFLDRVVPVAAEYKIKIACHPQDPGVPSSGYRGVDRVLGTVQGLKDFVMYRENPYHGLNFCQGTISEDLANPADEIFDVIRWFGIRRKIFNVHFRNIRGGRDDFVETFPDDGDVDFVKALQVYKEVGYDGMIQPDHVPVVPGDPASRDEGFAFAYGYIRALIQAV